MHPGYPSVAYLGEDHGGDLLGGESVDTAEVVNLDLGVAVTIVDNLEGPRLHVLLDGGVIDAATDETPGGGLARLCLRDIGQTMDNAYLTSKTVFLGFMAAWFLAASPIKRSSAVKETKEGVVKEPCSLAMISTLVPS